MTTTETLDNLNAALTRNITTPPDAPWSDADIAWGVEMPGLYDGVLYWQLHDGRTAHRFPAGSPYRAKAERFVTVTVEKS